MSIENQKDKLLKLEVIKEKCETDHLFFTRYFFKHRQSIKFRVNWHHHLLSNTVDKILDGSLQNVVINIPPGSSKTEVISINLIARGIALNKWSRFLHLSYSDDLALTNSQQAREIVESDEFQELWPMEIAVDSKAKKKWNVMHEGRTSGGTYAAALGGQITGFRAGRMVDGFQGAIIIDDPLKPEDAFSKTKRDAANRKLLSTVKSRKANPDTPIIIIMQRLSEDDVTDFVMKGNLGLEFKKIIVPAIIDDDYVKALPPEIGKLVDSSVRDDKGRFSYWEYKEPIAELNKMEEGAGTDKDGSRMSRHVFGGQYIQNPKAIGGSLIRTETFKRCLVKDIPKCKARYMIADTASKTKEHNDYSVFEVWGETEVGNDVVLLDVLRGRWEAPELLRRSIAFWKKHTADQSTHGVLRHLYVEDKSSGTGLIQTLRSEHRVPVKDIQRNTDKYSRCLDAQPYIEMGHVIIPLDADYTSDFIKEAEDFTADNTHAFDDQLDPMFDMIEMKYLNKSKINKWSALAGQQ